MTQTSGLGAVFQFEGARPSYMQPLGDNEPLGQQLHAEVTDLPEMARQQALTVGLSRLEQIVEYLRVLYR